MLRALSGARSFLLHETRRWPPKFEREMQLSHKSLFVKIFLQRQLAGSCQNANGGYLEKDLSTQGQKAALSFEILFVETFIRTVSPLSMAIWKQNISPICIATEYYETLTLCVVSTIRGKLCVSIVVFISWYHHLVWSTNRESRFHGEGWRESTTVT